MIHDRIENFRLYPFGKIWEEAFTFIQEASPQTKEGRYELSQGMYVSIEEYPTKEHAKAIFESHRKHIDIQWTILGAEAIAYSSIDKLEEKVPYNEKSDVIFYKHPDIFHTQVSNFSGTFTLLFPEDAHMPQLQVEGFERVKKGVVKIPVDQLIP